MSLLPPAARHLTSTRTQYIYIISLQRKCGVAYLTRRLSTRSPNRTEDPWTDVFYPCTLQCSSQRNKYVFNEILGPYTVQFLLLLLLLLIWSFSFSFAWRHRRTDVQCIQFSTLQDIVVQVLHMTTQYLHVCRASSEREGKGQRGRQGGRGEIITNHGISLAKWSRK